ncbi:MAG: DUF5683 domain-containing protein [Bacteroidota bacterium]
MKPFYLLIMVLGFSLLTLTLEAQVDTTSQRPDINTVLDTSQAQEEIGKGFFAYDEFNNPIPKKSLVYSFVVPGMGQAYNRKWWKLPFVYGAVGGIVYAIDFNQGLYRRFRDALEAELNDQEHEFTNTTIGNANSLRSLRDTYDRYTQTSYMGAIAVYGVIAIEAFVDGHLQSFDISDDLSLKVEPAFDLDPIFNRPTVGVSFKVTFD